MSSVRDENPNRPQAKQPALQDSETHRFWSPVDGLAGGSWWAVNDLGNTIILLNGAFKNHLPNNRTFRKSRGLIVKELAQQTDLVKSWEVLDLLDIEPFTLVIRQNGRLFDCRWDGALKHTKELSSTDAHIWSSAPLYTPEIQRFRESLFAKFIKSNPTSPEQLKGFLHSYEDKENGFIMHRFDFLQSLSVSVFHFHGNSADVTYEDLISGEKSQQTIHFTQQ